MLDPTSSCDKHVIDEHDQRDYKYEMDKASTNVAEQTKKPKYE